MLNFNDFNSSFVYDLKIAFLNLFLRLSKFVVPIKLHIILKFEISLISSSRNIKKVQKWKKFYVIQTNVITYRLIS